ncbi:hypothetical protein [Actinokineospora sp.]|uniref:hypothetical protein n=1 Tax=Actinokineospora sp. TaxID=1872133 RepID=UPI003D6BEE9E
MVIWTSAALAVATAGTGWALLGDPSAPALSVVTVISLTMARLGMRPAGPPRSTVDNTVDDVRDSSLDRATATFAWVDGSRADWDRHVRPLFAGHLEAVLGSAATGRATGELLFGADLWGLVDPSQPFTEHLDRPGPGRRAVGEILNRLEQLL